MFKLLFTFSFFHFNGHQEPGMDELKSDLLAAKEEIAVFQSSSKKELVTFNIV